MAIQLGTHSPGPWGVTTEGRSRLLVRQENGTTKPTLCQVMAGYVGDSEARANARLIAAAPDLLSACEEAWQWMFNVDDGGETGAREVVEKLAAAINKADGR